MLSKLLEHLELNFLLIHNLFKGIKWIELLESEFDKRFVDLDLVLNQLNETDRQKDKSNEKSTEEIIDNPKETAAQAKNTLNEISSIFAQLAHKALVVFDQNSKLENDLDNCKKELKFVKSERKLLERKLQRLEDDQTKQNELANFNTYNSLTRQIPSVNSARLSQSNRVMSLSNVSRSSSSLFNIKCNYPQQLNDFNFSEIYAEQEISNLRDDNVSLKKLNISLKSELFGARLAIKYLNKELSGRIQQIQILSKFNC